MIVVLVILIYTDRFLLYVELIVEIVCIKTKKMKMLK